MPPPSSVWDKISGLSACMRPPSVGKEGGAQSAAPRPVLSLSHPCPCPRGGVAGRKPPACAAPGCGNTKLHLHSPPESEGNRKRVGAGAHGTDLGSVRGSDTRTRACPVQSTAKELALPQAGLGWHLGQKKIKKRRKKKTKLSSDLIYLNKYKYKFYIKLFTNKPTSQTQTT